MVTRLKNKFLQKHILGNLVILFALFSIQFIASGISTLSITPDPKYAVLFGYSKLRLALVGLIGLAAMVSLLAASTAYRKQITFDRLYGFLKRHHLLGVTYLGLSLLVIWGWINLFSPDYLFTRWIFHYLRMKPVSLVVGLAALEFLLLALFSRNKVNISGVWIPVRRSYLLPALFFAVLLVVMAAFIGLTKIGLVLDTPFWNVPGIPLSSMQLSGLLLVVGMCIFIPSVLHLKPLKDHRLVLALPVFIYALAVLVWGFTPMLRDTLSSLPVFPHYQPYPLQDAKVHDVGALSILKGYGILFKGYTDKPLYMVFLAILHTIAGYDYYKIAWLQIAFLGVVPVILFFMGKKYHSVAFGIFISLVLIVRQRNAIALSVNIASVNPKLLMTEIITLFNLVLFTYLLFLWFSKKKTWLALLAGGAVGVASLIRLNPFLLFPAMFVLVIIVFWKSAKQILKHLAAYILGFMILVSPWLVSGVSPEGYPWFFIKFIDVINVRYNQNLPADGSYVPSTAAMTQFLPANSGAANAALSSPGWSGIAFDSVMASPRDIFDLLLRRSFQQIPDLDVSHGDIYIILNHWLHNFTTALMALPDSLVYDDIYHLSQRVYWNDSGGWTGEFPAVQIVFILINLLLVSIGLGYSWRRYCWAGLAPAAVFVVYSLSLALAKNSGSRYIVPIDWIVYFYYGLAIVLIGQFIKRIFQQPDGLFLSPEPNKTGSSVINRRYYLVSLIGLFVLAGLIPICNNLLPVWINPSKGLQETVARIEAIPGALQEGDQVEFGNILYPYYADDGNIYFTLLTSTDTNEVSIHASDLMGGLSIDDQVAIIFGGSQIKAIYLLHPSLPELIWSSGK